MTQVLINAPKTAKKGEVIELKALILQYQLEARRIERHDQDITNSFSLHYGDFHVYDRLPGN